MTGPTSLLLLAYNSQATIAEAMRAALAQKGEPLDILVSDDCSTDGTFAIIERLAAAYSGPHRVRWQRQSRNLGLVGNLTAAASRCEGGLILLAAGDDRSHPDRALRLSAAWKAAGCPSAAVVYSDVAPIDANGELVRDWPERVARPPWSLERLAESRDGPLGGACAITPRILGEPGPIDSTVRHEDRITSWRALLLGGQILFVDEALVHYRVTGGTSRIAAASRYEELTANARRRLTNMLPDARQRLADADGAGAPPEIVRLCRQVLAEQTGMLAMSDGRKLVRKAVRAIGDGARPVVMAKHLARFVVAQAERLIAKQA